MKAPLGQMAERRFPRLGGSRARAHGGRPKTEFTLFENGYAAVAAFTSRFGMFMFNSLNMNGLQQRVQDS